MTSRGLALALVVAALLPLASACADPVHDDAVEALGAENPNVPEGPLHRPGQPCLVCHDGSGPADLTFSFGGTVYQTEQDKTPMVGATVLLTDSSGAKQIAETNCAGNFFVEAVDFAPVFPVHVQVEFEAAVATMRSHIGVQGSCAACHVGKDTGAGVDHVYLAQGPMTFPPSGCK
ncbi:MAG TPA: hypothetical protein VHB21_18180 [Minicystis sp.]|nr:hypothetical protein [Minicystis sp.]